MNKHLYIDVKNKFEEFGYKLLSTEYTNTHTPLKYMCPNNHIGHIRFYAFVNGSRCASCAKTKKLKYDEVKQLFENESYILKSTQYKNNRSKLEYICANGHVGVTTLFGFKRGNRCAECANVKQKDFKFIKTEFENRNYKLLSTEYKNAHSKLKCICPNNHEIEISWHSIRKGHGCNVCGYLNNSKEMHPRWITDRSKINKCKELHKSSDTYKRKYRKLHNITDSNLHVDHIFPISAFHEHKIYDLDIINDFDNFQILPAEKNRIKSGKYDKSKFYEYLKSKNYKWGTNECLNEK